MSNERPGISLKTWRAMSPKKMRLEELNADFNASLGLPPDADQAVVKAEFWLDRFKRGWLSDEIQEEWDIIFGREGGTVPVGVIDMRGPG